MRKIVLNISDAVAETLLITLYAKAVESGKENPLITDAVAVDLVSKIDYNFSKFKNKTATSVGVAIRANHFDKVTKAFLQGNNNPIVVIVGCGLDARKQRIGEIAKKGRFYLLDLPEVINIRKELIPLEENETFIASSMLNKLWMNELIAKHPNGNFIFIIEGVLMYFEEEDNKVFFKQLAKRFYGAEIHFDMLNKWMSKKTAVHDTVSKTRATFKFGIDDEKEIEKWHHKLKHCQTTKFFELKGYKKMGRVLTFLMKFIPALKNSSQILNYRIEI